MKNFTRAISTMAVLAVTVASLGSVSAFAAEMPEASETQARPAFSVNMGARADGLKFREMGNFSGREKIELTEEEKAARLEDCKAALAEKLAASEITQEKYDEMLAAMESGNFMFGGNGFKGMNGEKPEMAAQLDGFKAALAEKFAAGEFTDEMIANMKSGEFLFSGNGFKGMNGEKPEKVELTEEEKAARLDGFKAALAEKLAAGEITQEKYDKMIAAMESGDFLLGGNGFRGMKGNAPKMNVPKFEKGPFAAED